ncbi:hypothetical protein CIT292_09220 [Citrobacter youngae ATCC 29220]|uniref:Uncharacterized protein n=1 Tax=Citrobacter youngae ATCC 29220 TaxID=500640 RepID=D4BG49_9ENTR|nr:hypothetical protein CIT292_09220 [Citrobacter youngae ATCC 29220]
MQKTADSDLQVNSYAENTYVDSDRQVYINPGGNSVNSTN